MKHLKLYEEFEWTEDDFDFEEEDLHYLNNDENLKKIIVLELVEGGYTLEESIDQVDKAKISLHNDIVTVTYNNGVVDHWELDGNKLINHF